MKDPKALIIALLIGISAFAVYKYAAVTKEKNSLLATFDKLKAEVSGLESEKQNLLQSIQTEKGLKEQIVQENSSIKERMADLEGQFAQAEEAVSQLNSQLSIAKAENTALQEEKNNLRGQLTQIQKENQEYSARLNSLEGLKIAIKELKMKMRQVKRVVKEKVSACNKIEGNKGFMTLNGESTQPTQNIKIEVKPASSSE